jgi:hypothetical protein
VVEVKVEVKVEVEVKVKGQLETAELSSPLRCW